MTNRVKRLKKLLSVQEQLKELHEAHHAAYSIAARAAAREATEIAEGMDHEQSFSPLFPDLYSRAIENACRREQENLRLAAEERQQIARISARCNVVERNYREARNKEERDRNDREILERISITYRTRE